MSQALSYVIRLGDSSRRWALGITHPGITQHGFVGGEELKSVALKS